jgi:DNA polymerase III delta prime subunit
MDSSNNMLLVNKYKPIYFSDFSEFCREENIFSLLRLLIAMDSLHIMLVGGNSFGKTSLLNAIIKEYYKDNYQNAYADNVLFINSLKEQGIHYFRNDVKTFCQTCSTLKNKKKIVVVDDIDYLNEQSQQIFRNCVDKFSHNVYFISSCSNMQKIIESLQSRFTIIKMNPIKREGMIATFDKIKNIEHIEVDELAKKFIITISNNNLKILINYMEKFKLLNKTITLELANKLCTNINFIQFEDFTTKLITMTLNKKDDVLKDAIKIMYNIYDQGYSVMDILDNYFIFIKNSDIVTEEQKYIIIEIICKYIAIFHNIHEDEIELAFFTNNLISSISNKIIK